MEFVKQTLDIAYLMNSWLNDKDIVKYAMFDSSFTDEFNYYENRKLDEELINTYLNAIYEENNLVGYVVIHYYIDGNKEYGYTINPIIICPKYQNHGLAKKAIEKIINGFNNDYVDYIEVKIDKTNTKSLKVFQHFNFSETFKENNMFTYRLYIKKDSRKTTI